MATKKKPATAKKSPTKKATPQRRATPKVSPLRGTSVESFIAKLPAPQRALVEKVIAVVKAGAPDLGLSIKWGQPVFESNGPLGWIRPAKAHVTLGFWRGAELSDADSLEGGGDKMRHLKVGLDDDVDAPRIRKLVKEAVKLNREKGDPTARK